jgi:hypothetical protein
MKDGGKYFSHLGWEELVGGRDGGEDFPRKGWELINGWALCGVVKCQVVVERGRQVWSMRGGLLSCSYLLLLG